MRTKHYLAAGACMLALALPGVAMAAEANEGGTQDIIVTAQRRAQKLEDIPASVSAVTGDSLEKAGVSNIHDLANVVAGVVIANGGSATQPAIRGVTSLLNTLGYETNVAVYVDGFYVPDFNTINGDFGNVSDIQILKGPQGTLYGRNATGGAILINTASPTKTLTGNIGASYASYNDVSIKGYIAGPLSNAVRASVGGYWRKSDSYLKLVNGPTSVPPTDASAPFPMNKFEQQAVRAKLEADLASNITLTLGANFAMVDDPRGYYFTTLEHPVSSTTAAGQFQAGAIAAGADLYRKALNRGIDGRAWTYEGTAKLAMKTDFGTLTSYTGYALRKYHQDYDPDGTYRDAGGYISAHSKQDTFQQTLDAVIDTIDGLKLVVGAMYYKDVFQADGPLGTATLSSAATGMAVTFKSRGRMATDAYALYADGEFNLSDRLVLGAGIRYSHDEKEFRTASQLPDGSGGFTPLFSGSLNKSWSKATPRASLRYELADRTNVYASWSQGYRSGTINQGNNATTNPIIAVNPETANAFEVGIKTAQPTFRASLAGFYTKYKNLQVSLSKFFEDTKLFGTVVSNAPAAETYGVDLEFSWNPVPELTLRGGAEVLHARYTDFNNWGGIGVNATTGLNVSQTQNLTGQQMPRSPNFSANFGIEYRMPVMEGTLTTALNGTYTDSYVLQNPSTFGTAAYDGTVNIGTTAAPNFPVSNLAGPLNDKQRYRQNAYAMFNLDMTWTDKSEHFSVGFFVKNLTNKTTRLLYNGNTTLGDYSTAAWPRQFGGKVGYKF